MKSIKYIIAFMLACLNLVSAQTVNWAGLKKEQRHIAQLAIGFDYGFTLDNAYHYQLKAAIPVIVGVGYSIPSGKNTGDDFKTKIGGQVRWVKIDNFVISSRIQGVFRRFDNSCARLINFGSDMALTAGYYKSKWLLAGEAGFDKAIVTHFKHSKLMEENFVARNGWFMPTTGGNIYYGLQSGFSLKNQDIMLRAGRIITQDFRTAPMLPFYLQIGYVLKIK